MLSRMTENLDVLMFVVMRDKKNITQTTSKIWLFCVSVSPFEGKGDLLPSDGRDAGSVDFELMHMIINTHEIVEMIPMRVRYKFISL